MRHALSVSLLFLLGIRLVGFLLFAPQPSDGQDVVFTSSIIDEPQTNFSTQTFTVLMSNAFGAIPVRVITKPSEQFKYEKKVKISGNLTLRALRTGRSVVTISPREISTIPSLQDNLMQFVLDIRQSVRIAFQKILSPNSAALLIGIVLGVRGEFAKGFLSAVQTTGVTHIIAASGMNVTMVGGFFFAIFSRFFRRQYTVLLVGLGVGWYVLLSGFQPSILRAAVMMVLSLGAQLFGRQYDGVYALFLTAGLLLFFSPGLLFNVGFQLSVSATLGILFIKPFFPKHPFLDDVSTTCAAQIATLPILLLAFGQYGLLSIVANALILWTIPFLMILGGLGALAAVFLPGLAGIFLYLAAPLLWYMEVVIDFFAKHSVLLSVSGIHWMMVAGYYIFLGSVVTFLSTRKKRVSLPPLQSHLPVQ